MNRPGNGSDNRFGSAKGRSLLAGLTPPRRPQAGVSRPSAPVLMGRTDPGPRPVSPRQREYRARVTGRDIIDREVPPEVIAVVPAERKWRTDTNRRHIRDAETTHLRRRKTDSVATVATQNRKRISPWPRLLRWSLLGLALECVAVAIWSPRFWVTKTTVEGNSTVSTARLLSDLAIKPHRSIAVLSVGQMRSRILGEPTIESATIHRSLPGAVQLIVKERTPWASVCLQNGDCYTIDRKLVPFRLSGPEDKSLPKLILGSKVIPADESSTDLAAVAPPHPTSVTLGKALKVPGLDVVSGCLVWASANQFPLDSVTIAPGGELCLNRTGGMVVKLGSGMDLDKKLNSLSVLLKRMPSLRNGSDIAGINLFAWEAPAILPRASAAAPHLTIHKSPVKNALGADGLEGGSSADSIPAGAQTAASTALKTSISVEKTSK